MAVFPCDFDGQRYRGSQQTIYPALVVGVDQHRRKLRLCSTHFESMLEQLTANARPAQDSYLDPDVMACHVCSLAVLDTHGAFFATVYATGAERADYWAPVHVGCLAEALRRWRLDEDMPLRDAETRQRPSPRPKRS